MKNSNPYLADNDPSIPSKEHCRNAPDSFQECFVNMAYGVSYIDMGFSNTINGRKIRLFCNRWRLANSFEGLHIKDYSPSSILGYSSLTKVFLTYSAFEIFVKLIDKDWFNCIDLFEANEIDKLYDIFIKTNINNGLTNFLIERANNQLILRLTKLINQNEDIVERKKEMLSIAAAIRHIFAHGYLTAHPKGVDELLFSKFNVELSRVMLEFMNAEFTKRVKSYDIGNLTV